MQKNDHVSFSYNEVLSGYQPSQMVEQRKNQHFKDHLCPHPQGNCLVSPRELHTQLPGKQQISFHFLAVKRVNRTVLEFTSTFQCPIYIYIHLCTPLLHAQMSPSDTNFKSVYLLPSFTPAPHCNLLLSLLTFFL